MRKFLLVLWLVGAGVYTLNTLVLTHTITGANDKLASVTEEDLAAQTLLLPQPKEAVAEPRPDAGALPVATTDEPDPRLRLDRKQLHDRMADNHHGLSGASSPAIPDNDSAPSELAVRAEQAEAVKNVEPTEVPAESREEQVAVQSSAPDEMAAEDAFADDRDEAALEEETATIVEEGEEFGTDEPSAELVTVSSRGANLRSGPSRAAPLVTSVAPSTQLRAVEREGGWVQVADEGGSPLGWIYGGLLEQSNYEGGEIGAEDANIVEPQSRPAVRKYHREGRAGRRGPRSLAGAVRRAIRFF